MCECWVLVTSPSLDVNLHGEGAGLKTGWQWQHVVLVTVRRCLVVRVPVVALRLSLCQAAFPYTAKAMSPIKRKRPD